MILEHSNKKHSNFDFMKIIFPIYLITLSSIAFCNEIEEQITRLVKKYAKEDSARVSNEINVSGACIANKGQLINTCKGQELSLIHISEPTRRM